MIRIVLARPLCMYSTCTPYSQHQPATSHKAEFKKKKSLVSILSLDFTCVKKARMRSERSDIAKGLAPELRVKRTDCNFQLLIRLVTYQPSGAGRAATQYITILELDRQKITVCSREESTCATLHRTYSLKALRRPIIFIGHSKLMKRQCRLEEG